MSRTYRCRVQKDLTITVRARDSITLRLGLHELVGEDETNEILRKVLEEAGGRVGDDGQVTLGIEGVQVVVDVEGRTAEASLGEDYELEASADEIVDSYSHADDKRAAQAAAEARVERDLKAELQRRKEAAEAATRAKLDAAEEAIRQTLREASAKTEIESLRRKAERMGRLLGITEEEDPKTGDRQVVIELELG